MIYVAIYFAIGFVASWLFFRWLFSLPDEELRKEFNSTEMAMYEVMKHDGRFVGLAFIFLAAIWPVLLTMVSVSVRRE